MKPQSLQCKVPQDPNDPCVKAVRWSSLLRPRLHRLGRCVLPVMMLTLLLGGCRTLPDTTAPTPTAVSRWSISAPAPVPSLRQPLGPLPYSPIEGPPRPGVIPLHPRPPYSPAVPPIRGLIPLQPAKGPIRWEQVPNRLPAVQQPQQRRIPGRPVQIRQPVQPVPAVITPANRPADYLTPTPPADAVIGPPRRSPVQPRPLLRPVPPVVVPQPNPIRSH